MNLSLTLKTNTLFGDRQFPLAQFEQICIYIYIENRNTTIVGRFSAKDITIKGQ